LATLDEELRAAGRAVGVALLAADMDQARRAFLLREYERGATDELSEESAAALYCVVRRQ